jgi:hypothetical protein
MIRPWLDMIDRREHPVFDAKVAIVFEEHDAVARRKIALAVIGLEGQPARPGPLLGGLLGDVAGILARRSATLPRASLPRSCSSLRIASLMARTSARRCAIATRVPSGR